MEWMILPLKRYAQFSGRSRRMEYWMFWLFSILVGAATSIIDMAIFGYDIGNNGPVNGVANLALLIPSIAVGVRRLHDTGRSGWWLLLIFLIIIGWIILLIWFCTDGTTGANKYGEDPKGGVDAAGVFD